MATESLTANALTAVPVGGTIHEDLMDAIYDISPEDRPFCDATGVTDSDNIYKEWVRESLEASDPDNATIDGDVAGADQSVTGERIGNYHQQASKVVKVSDRGRNVRTVGSSDELLRQLMKRQKALRRDEEATYVSRNAALAGNDTTAGKCAGVGAWIGSLVDTALSVTSVRGAGGTDPELTGNPTAGGWPDVAAGEGTKGALTETNIKNMMRAAYENGGYPTLAMSAPAAIEVLSDYLFTSSARVAALQTETGMSNRTDNSTGGGRSGGGVVAQGSVNILVTNFGTLELVPNLFQPQAHAADATVFDMYLIDPDLWERAYLQGYETKELARVGTAENRQITVDFSLCALNPEGNAVIADIDTAIPAEA